MNNSTVGNLILSLIVASSAFAGTDSCKSQGSLTCESTYKLISGYDQSPIKGTMAASKISDINGEPFDPTVCQASLALFSYAGRFGITYSESDSSVRIWLETDGKSTVVTENMKLSTKNPLNLTIKSPLKGVVDTVTVTCSLKD